MQTLSTGRTVPNAQACRMLFRVVVPPQFPLWSRQAHKEVARPLVAQVGTVSGDEASAQSSNTTYINPMRPVVAARALSAQYSRLAQTPRQQHSHATATSSANRDAPEVDVLRACLVFAGGIALYTASQELVSPRAGSFFNVNLRGDIDKQMAAAEQAAVREGRTQAGGLSDSTAKGHVKHTWWWRLAHVKKDTQGTAANVAMADTKLKAPVLSRMA